MNVRYRVELSQSEHEQLTGLLHGGKHAARKIKRAQILLAADAGASDETIASTVGVGGSTVYRTKRRFVEGNLEAALSEEPRPSAERKLSGKEEALLVATACSSPPAGRARWTLALLADEIVKLTEHKGLSRETVRRRLAENDLKPWRRDMWCISAGSTVVLLRLIPEPRVTFDSPRGDRATGQAAGGDRPRTPPGRSVSRFLPADDRMRSRQIGPQSPRHKARAQQW
jgi:transposase